MLGVGLGEAVLWVAVVVVEVVVAVAVLGRVESGMSREDMATHS